jgi:ADP-heptose:LPS heptosyltransferase
VRQVIEDVVSSSDCTVIVIGGKSDRVRMEAFRGRGPARERVRLLTPVDLEGLADIIAGSIAFVGTDSGPIHLASLLGVPTVGLFGPAPPDLTAPLPVDGDYLYHHVECSPCRQKHCIRAQNPCMQGIPAADVLELVRRKLTGKPMQMTAA